MELAVTPPLRPASVASVLSAAKDRFDRGTFAPPFRPAVAARSESLLKLRDSAGTDFPPRRAISRRRSGDMDAKPLLEMLMRCLLEIPHTKDEVFERLLLRSVKQGLTETVLD